MIKIGPYKIESPYFLAPMAGVSQMPFRKLALKMGAGLATTELISAKGICFANTRTKSYLIYDEKIERPFSVQLFGGEEDAMARAAQIAVKMGAEIIDINMGCPVKKVTKTNAGSALMCDYKRAQKIVEAMKNVVGADVPITAKIRSGWDLQNLNYIEVARALEDAGIAAIAIHPRTRSQGYSGQACWQHIFELKKHLDIPVIGNGDVKTLADAKKMMKETGCDAVMIGRGALGNPWVFSENERPSLGQERLSLVKSHFEEHIELRRLCEKDEKREFSLPHALKTFRSHLMWYSTGLSGGAKFRQQVNEIEDYELLLTLIDEFFSDAKSSTEGQGSFDGVDYRQAFG